MVKLDAVLFSKFPEEYLRLQKERLGECGVNVLKVYNSERLGKPQIPKCDVVLFMYEMASQGDCDAVEKLSKKYELPFVRLTRRYSRWPDLFRPLLKKREKAGPAEPEVIIRRKKAEPVLVKGIRTEEQLPLPQSETRLKAAPVANEVVVLPPPPLPDLLAMPDTEPDPETEISAPESILNSEAPKSSNPRPFVRPVRPRPPMPPLPSNSPLRKLETKLAEVPPAPPSAPEPLVLDIELVPESKPEPKVASGDDDKELANLLMAENDALRAEIGRLQARLAVYEPVAKVLDAIATIQDYLAAAKRYAQAAE